MITRTPVSFMKESELIKRAATRRKITLRGTPKEHSSHPEFDSENVGTFKLDKNFISALEKRGFSFGPGSDPIRNGMVYLSGNSHQGGKPIFESDCWAWERTKSNPQLTIYFRLLASEDKKGVVCMPEVWGNCSGGACHIPTINNFVRVVAEHFQGVHPLIKEAADTNFDFEPVIFWGEINMAGIKSVERLFYEMYGRNEKVATLARSNLSPFDPNPYPQRSIFEVNDRPFVPESEQPKLFEQWKEQLRSFKDSLA